MTSQQVCKMIDNLNPKGLEHIISVLKGLGDDNWVKPPEPEAAVTGQISKKKAALQGLEECRRELEKYYPEGFDADSELSAALEEKYGHFDRHKYSS